MSGLESTIDEAYAQSGSSTFHVVNPQASSWSRDVVPILLNSFSKDTVRPVSFEDWIARLKLSAEPGADDMDKIPAIRLVDFYEACLAGKDAGRSVLSSVAAQSASPTLRGLSAVRKSWLELWLTQWRVATAAK